MGTISPERTQSNDLLRRLCAPITGQVLSIGSGGDIDKEGQHYRDYFPAASQYVTSDVVAGCDLWLDARAMRSVQEASFHAVFCSGVLEHVDDYGAVVRECHRILKYQGVLLVGVPFKQPIHRAPGDFWRFTEHGVRQMLRAFSVELIVPIGDPAFPFAYWAQARKV